MRNNNSHILKVFKQRVSRIQKELEGDKTLVDIDKTWLGTQRRLYTQNSKKYATEKKKLLDTLIPFLGYDWKQYRTREYNIYVNERVVSIKKALYAGKEIAKTDQQWLTSVRRKYNKDNAYLNATQQKKLKELNPLLKRPWHKTPSEIEKNVTSFEDHIQRIRTLNTSLDKLPKRYQDWLKNQRELYIADKEYLSKENISQLDSLTSILKTEWSVDIRYNFELLQKQCSTIKRKLKRGEHLTKQEKAYLAKKRTQYRQGILFSSRSIKTLDSLTPLLGYDWKENKRSYTKAKTFEQHLSEIRCNLQNHIVLTRKQKAYLRMQRIYYSENPETYPKHKFDALERLIPLLNYDWKYSRRPYPQKHNFEERAILIKKHLSVSKDTLNLTIEDKDWLRRHRRIYRSDPKLFDKKRALILDSMNDLLGYDWKTYVIERT
ncbi:hypothetical protein [Aquimarina agarivorans]|uniref:hypothetical protein n=1 Tax=Aquimarina agarivorans TaxID=980584 RepID=UPI000248E8D8|nr:hypothetical protein [Aquimarina agarivorans]